MFTERECYVLIRSLVARMRKLAESGDYPEFERDNTLLGKLTELHRQSLK